MDVWIFENNDDVYEGLNNIFLMSTNNSTSNNVSSTTNGSNFNVTTGGSGQDGLTPNIGENGNWWIGEKDTGVKAEGKDGIDGLVPFINELGNWQIGTVDTGIKAQGSNGEDGETPTIGDNGNWFIKGVDTGVKAKGIDGVTPNITANAVSVPSTSPANVIQTGTPENPIFTFEIPKGQDGAAGLAPRVYHMDLSKVGNQIDIILDGIRAQYIYSSATTIRFNLHSGSSNNVVIDLKRSTQLGNSTIEGSSLDNFTLTPSYQLIDTINNDSTEMHRTWIRTKDPTTGLWSLFQIDLFVSNGGMRTDIVVYTIYSGQLVDYFDR